MYFLYKIPAPAGMVRGSLLRFRRETVQVAVLAGEVGDAGTGLAGVQVVVADDEGTRVAAVQVLDEEAQLVSLRLGACVGGLTADVEPALVADADGVGVVSLAVCADHVFGSPRLYAAVASYDVVVADAELPAPAAVPRVDLGGR